MTTLANRPNVAPLVVGAKTDAFIRATLHGAFVRGYDVTLVSDAHTTEDLPPCTGTSSRAPAGRPGRSTPPTSTSAARPNRYSTTETVTSMLPRVALEYGQTWWAASANDCAVARSRLGA